LSLNHVCEALEYGLESCGSRSSSILLTPKYSLGRVPG
jgi:hypothetical protein